MVGTIGPATGDAIIVFANTPGARCTSCDTVKISVAPSGRVLIERGSWQGDKRSWRYKRSSEDVGPQRAAAFAASLSGDRPTGQRLRDGGNTCLQATEDDGLVIEWIEADRHDLLTFKFSCPAGRNGPLAQRLRQAPALLGLRGVDFSGDGGR